MISTLFYDYAFHWITLLSVIPFVVYYYRKTVRKDRNIYWFIQEDGEEKFDYDFLLKIFFQLSQIYLTFFTFFNIIYFVFEDKWYSDDSLRSSKGFIFIGAVVYIINLFQKSSNVLYDHKQKKVKVHKSQQNSEPQK